MYNDIYDKEQMAYNYNVLLKWIELKIEGRSLNDLLQEQGIETIMLYGIGGIGEYVYQELIESDIKISGIIDKRFEAFGGIYEDVPMFGLDNIPSSSEHIIVTPIYYFKEIMEELIARNIDLERIVSLSMLLT